MSGLFMAFTVNREPKPAKKKKPPRLPSRGEISEDSMEDMVSQDLDRSMEDPGARRMTE